MNRKPSETIFHVSAEEVARIFAPAADVDRSAPEPAGTPAAAPRQKWRVEIPNGPELWHDLHVFASLGRVPDAGWWAWFAKQLPCGQCRADWFRQMHETPPPAAAADFFAWTVDRHNEVNRRLGKPEMTAEAARRVWGLTVADSNRPETG